MASSSLIVLSLLAIAGLVFGEKCLNPETPENCDCETQPWSDPEVLMTCRVLTDPGQVYRALKLNPNVGRLHLVNCNLPFFPLGLAPHKLVQLFITNSSLQYLSPVTNDRSAFDGLTNLTTLVAKGVENLSLWDWSKLVPLVNLELIHVVDSNLQNLPTSVSQLGKNRYWTLNVTNSHLLHISANALGSKVLGTFSSRGNPLRTFRKDMMYPSKAIMNLEIVGSRANSVDRYFISELSQLTTLIIDAQFLPYLTYSSSSPFYRNLHFISIVGEPPLCKCQYSFLLDNGIGWDQQCVLSTSSGTTRYILAEFLNEVCR